MEEIIYQQYNSFDILGRQVNISSEETCYGRNTVMEIEDEIYYLGDEYPGIATAIFGWQEHFNVELSTENLIEIIDTNKIRNNHDN